MKTKLFFAFLIVFKLVHAQTPNWSWAKAAGGLGDDIAASMSTDGNGNSYVTGSFGISPAAFGNFTLTGPGNGNFFIAKYDNAGIELWVKSGVSIMGSGGSDIRTDAAGNSYVSGFYYGGTFILDSYTLTGIYMGYNGFIAKYDASGNVVWVANTIEFDPSSLYMGSIAIDAGGNSYVAINGKGAPADSIVALMKYSAAGVLLWKRYMKGIGVLPYNYWRARDVSTDANGNSYLCGIFTSSLLTLSGVVLTNTSQSQQMFIAKYDNAGNVIWTQNTTGTYHSFFGPSISVDANGDACLTGHFTGPSAIFGSTVIASNAGAVFFVTKLDNSGNFIWVTGGNNSSGNGIVTDANNNIYISGSFTGGNAGSAFGGTTLYSNGGGDVFIVKLDPSGNVIWAKSVGGTLVDNGLGPVVDGLGNVYVTGFFKSKNLVFDNTVLVNCDTTLNSYEIFVAKLDGGASTGIGNLSGQHGGLNAVSIFPNPFSGETIIKTNSQFENAELDLYNSNGQALKQVNNINGPEIKFSRDDLPAGMYFFQIRQNHAAISGKIIVTD